MASEQSKQGTTGEFVAETTKVLLIEDNQADTVLFTRSLGSEYWVVNVTHIAAAVPLLLDDAGGFDVVVADLGLPDAKGLAVLRRLRDTGTSTPVVVLTSRDDEIFATQAIEYGIQDYLVKESGNAEQIKRVIRFAIARKKSQSRLIYLALNDSLTGLGNRVTLNERLGHSIRRATRRMDSLGVAFLDIDQLKQINDEHGHDAGDHVLQRIATRITDAVRDSDSVVRTGGDEFAVILEDLASGPSARVVLEKLVTTSHQPLQIYGSQVEISVSIGAAFFPDDGMSVETLTHNAGVALSAAKEQGGHRWQLFQELEDAEAEPD